ncbi:unnamed protein product, partial [Owenia fusiformis]
AINMAATRILRRFRLNLQNCSRKNYSGGKSNSHSRRTVATICTCSTGLLISVYVAQRNVKSWFNSPTILAKEKEDDEETRRPLLSHRERRFLAFASLDYKGNVYMTPQDFLESVTEEAPRPRISRHRLELSEIEAMTRKTPDHQNGSTHLFRNLNDKGIISYTEYLFLLCVLTKPHSGFRIAFNMFDTDGNEKVDKKEFMV